MHLRTLMEEKGVCCLGQLDGSGSTRPLSDALVAAVAEWIASQARRENLLRPGGFSRSSSEGERLWPIVGRI